MDEEQRGEYMPVSNDLNISMVSNFSKSGKSASK